MTILKSTTFCTTNSTLSITLYILHYTQLCVGYGWTTLAFIALLVVVVFLFWPKAIIYITYSFVYYNTDDMTILHYYWILDVCKPENHAIKIATIG